MEPGEVVYSIYADDIIFYTIPTRKDPTKTALLGLSHFSQLLLVSSSLQAHMQVTKSLLLASPFAPRSLPPMR